MANLPVWTQLSGHTLATLEERLTTTVILPLDPSSADLGGLFNPESTALSSDPLPTLINSTVIDITKTWSQEPSGYTYPISIRIPTITPLTCKKIPVAILLHGSGGIGSNEITIWENYLGDHILVAPS